MRHRSASGRFRDLLGRRLELFLASRATADLDLARLHRLGDDALQRDGEQAVLEIGRSDLDEIRQLEAALEPTRGDAAVQILAFVLVRSRGRSDFSRSRAKVGQLSLEDPFQ
jgi:hypothetical protein